MGLRHRTLLLAVLVGLVIPIGASTAAAPLFSEDFEGSLACYDSGAELVEQVVVRRRAVRTVRAEAVEHAGA